MSQLAYTNWFSPEFLECQRQVLGPDYQEGGSAQFVQVDDPGRPNVNSRKVHERVAPLLESLRKRLAKGVKSDDGELVLYEDAVLLWLYYRYLERLSEATFLTLGRKPSKDRWAFYGEFLADWEHYLNIPGVTLPTAHQAPHVFGIFIQFRRAFRYIHTHIIGQSPSVARLRAAVWQSIFTHDLRRYQRTLYRRMGDFVTLITGPSGTGKELVAQALAKSRYVPFDGKRLVLNEPPEEAFYPINLPALSSALIESELFGHRRGAFTGAVRDRRGRLEICPPLGTVFLDEIGDLEPLLQVKLLRVIESRTFQAVGDDADRRFEGKIVAATNRDLSLAISEGNFREDLYFRLCSDQIVMPSLHGVLQESSDALSELALFMAQRVLSGEGDDDEVLAGEAEILAREVEGWIVNEMGSAYRWPGNYRELEQCVRNVLIHKEYRPLPLKLQYSHQAFFSKVTTGQLNADELLRWYCTLVYSLTDSYAETACRLQLDRRTVKSRIDPQLLDQLRNKG